MGAKSKGARRRKFYARFRDFWSWLIKKYFSDDSNKARDGSTDKHTTVHSNQKWLHCITCKSPFASAWDLMVHVQTAHMLNIYLLADTNKLVRQIRSWETYQSPLISHVLFRRSSSKKRPSCRKWKRGRTLRRQQRHLQGMQVATSKNNPIQNLPQSNRRKQSSQWMSTIILPKSLRPAVLTRTHLIQMATEAMSKEFWKRGEENIMIDNDLFGMCFNQEKIHMSLISLSCQ